MAPTFYNNSWRPLDRGPMVFGLDTSDESRDPAVLRFRNPMGTLAQFEDSTGCWTFKRIGVWQPSISIRETASDRDFAVYRRIPGMYTGGISTTDFRQFRVIERMPDAGVDILNEKGEYLVSARPTENRLVCRIETSRQPQDFGNDGWMLGFAWYLILLSLQDAQETPIQRMALTASRLSIS